MTQNLETLPEASSAGRELAHRSPAEPVFAPAVLTDPIDTEAVPSDDDAIQDAWELIKVGRGKLLSSLVLGAVAGFLISLPQTPMYEARASIEIEAANDNYLNLRDVNPTSDVGRSAELEIATHAQALESRSLLTSVTQRLGLAQRPEFEAPSGGLRGWLDVLGVDWGADSTAAERALEATRENVRIVTSSKTRIVEIVSAWPDADLAAEVANALAEAYIDERLNSRWEAAQRTSEWLSRQLDDLRLRLEESAERMQQYARLSGLMFTGERESVAQERLRQLQDELSSAQASRISKQSTYELLSSSDADAVSGLVGGPALQELEMRLADLRRAEAELGASFTDEFWRVKRLKAQIAEAEKALAAETARGVERTRNDYQAALKREQMLRDYYESQARVVAEQSDREIRYSILAGEVETNRELYNSLLQKVKEAGVASAMRVSTIQVVDPAVTPRFRSRPSHLLNTLLGLLAGAVAGFVWVFAGEKLDGAVKAPGELARRLRVTELGAIPVPQTTRSVARSASEAEPLQPSIPEQDAELVQLIKDARDSMLTEHFRAVVTSILFAAPSGDHASVFVITSPSPGEGKTTVATSIAATMAEVRGRVLLIDADMRKPRVHRVFGLSNRRGLTDLLRGEAPLEAASEGGLFQPSGLAGLTVLTSGPPFLKAPNLLHSQTLRELLEHLEHEFDAIIIDTPPMLQIADARILGQLADGVILVVRANQTLRLSAKAAVQRLQQDGARLVGSVLNGWNPRSGGNGYYGEYRSYTSYYRPAVEEPKHA